MDDPIATIHIRRSEEFTRCGLVHRYKLADGTVREKHTSVGPQDAHQATCGICVKAQNKVNREAALARR